MWVLCSCERLCELVQRLLDSSEGARAVTRADYLTIMHVE